MTIGGLTEQSLIGNVATFVISASDVSNAINFSTGTLTFDLRVKVYDSAGNNGAWLDVDTWGDAGSNNYLVFDRLLCYKI